MRPLALLTVFLLPFFIPAQNIILSEKEFNKLQRTGEYQVISATPMENFLCVNTSGLIDLVNEYDPEGLSQMFSKLEINLSQPIILMDNQNGYDAGKLFWILQYAGAQDIFYFPGTPSRIVSSPQTDLLEIKPVLEKSDDCVLVSMIDVKNALYHPDYMLVDTRKSPEISGMIPGAFQLKADHFFTNNKLKDTGEIRLIFEEYGLYDYQNIILYGNGVQDSGLIFMLLKATGYQNVAIYPGGIQEWVSFSSNRIM